MNSDSPKNPGEELELRITALLLGELSDDEASALRRTIAQDAELGRLHDRLKFAIELARETSTSPTEEEMAKPEELKLAPERRAKLLATFAAPKIVKLAQQRRTRRELLALAAMVVGLLAVAGLLVMNRDERQKQFTLLGRASVESSGEPAAASASYESGRALPQLESRAKDAPDHGIQISGQLNGPPLATVAPASQPTAPARPAPVPAGSIRGSDASPYPKLTDRNAFALTPPPENKEEPKSGKTVVSAGAIALPEVQVSDPDWIGVLNTRFADTAPQSANEFTALSGGGGGGRGGGMAQKPASSGPQGGQTAGWFNENNRNSLFYSDTLSQSAKAGDVAGPVKVPEQPLALVDPATGLPAEYAYGTVVAGVPFVVGTNGIVANYSRFAETAPAGQVVAGRFENRFANIVNQPAAPGVDYFVEQKSDFDTDGKAIDGRFKADGLGRAETEKWEMAKEGRLYSDTNRSANRQENNDEYLGLKFYGRRPEIALPSQNRGDKKGGIPTASPTDSNEIAANPVGKSLEGLIDTPGKPASVVDGERGRDLDSLRQERDKLLSKLASQANEKRLLQIPQETVDAIRPRSPVVEIVDSAEAKPSNGGSFWKALGGVFGGGVERSARLKVEKDAPDVAGLNDRKSTGYDPYWVQTETEAIQSKSVLSNVAAKLDLEKAWGEKRGGEKLKPEETYALLKKRTTVSTDPKSGLIDIKVKSDNAEEAARIANTIAEVYREQRLNEGRESKRRGLKTLEQALAEQEQKIAQVQDLEQRSKEVNATKDDAGIPKPASAAGIPQPEVLAAENPFSTFSLNVSDVSFKLAAASLEKGALPDVATVRTEEFINAFDYHDPEPLGSAPIAFAWDRARYPFAHDRDLVRFSLKTAASGRQPGRPLNLVLLLDNSGSMERADRLRIRQECLRVLASQLQTNDRVSVVAFARTAQLWVDGLPGNQGGELPERVGNLTPQGGTNLEEAMNLAYQTALRHYLANGVNRVVLLTDGAANLGDVAPESLKKKVEANRQQGIALDCFGIGWEGYNDDLLEVLSRNGDGRYGFVNTPEAASSEFAGQLAGALKVAASDVKVQVEFNPRRVTAYRQLGYAKHQLTKEQFRDNTVDAAEIGATEAGNALYVVQVNPRGEGPLGTVRVRFKVPGTSDYREHEWAVPYDGAARPLEQSPFPMRLAGTAAAFSEWLVSSPYAAEVAPDRLLTYLSGVPESCPADPRPKKLEWMIRQAKSVAGK
jgi:Mg-chelatase subunit ChlD